MSESESVASEHLLALRSVLKPVVRLCLRRGLKLQALIEIAKEQFLEAAADEVSRAGEAPSASKISVMTGVHRKDVARFQQSPTPQRAESDVITRIIGQWQHDPRFQTQGGKPKTLTCQGTASEFAALVRSVSKELSVYPILFELERMNMVARRGNSVTLLKKTNIRRDNAVEGFRFLAEDADDLIAAVEENLATELKTPNLHIKTEFDQIPVEHLAQLRKWLLQEGTKFHLKVRKFLSQYDAEINPELKTSRTTEFGRIAFGTFSRSVPTIENEDE
ncbi:MAG: hypothetical protein KDD69_14195 [Bdellovibrionales bacterium]|nr:hypothetical protein [Bdellovibrionales bacterium]